MLAVNPLGLQTRQQVGLGRSGVSFALPRTRACCPTLGAEASGYQLYGPQQA